MDLIAHVDNEEDVTRMPQDTPLEEALGKYLIGLVEKRLDDHDLLTEVKALQGAMAQDIKSLTAATREQLKDHEERLRELEGAREREAGTQRVIAACVSVFVSAIVALIVGVILNMLRGGK